MFLHETLEFSPATEMDFRFHETTAHPRLSTGGCDHCGMIHRGACPRIKRIDYYEDGRVKSVEYHERR